MSDLLFETACSLLARIRRRELSVLELMRATLAQVERINPEVNAIVSFCPEQALVMTGRFPRCKFANVVLWNRYLQSFDYNNRNISLNRKQTKLEPDGRFKMVISHRNPGIPNWIDTEGRPSGIVYWRFLLPEGEIETPQTEVVEVASLG